VIKAYCCFPIDPNGYTDDNVSIRENASKKVKPLSLSRITANGGFVTALPGCVAVKTNIRAEPHLAVVPLPLPLPQVCDAYDS
jgi:hypothetical protein